MDVDGEVEGIDDGERESVGVLVDTMPTAKLAVLSSVGRRWDGDATDGEAEGRPSRH